MLSLLLACTTRPAAPEPAPVAASPPSEAAPADLAPTAPDLTLYAYFAMDDKYQTAVSAEARASWEGTLRADLQAGTGSHRDVLSSDGGGPLGAEWNADADLLVIATTHAAGPLTATLIANSTDPIPAEIHPGSPTLLAWSLPHSVWQPALRPSVPDNLGTGRQTLQLTARLTTGSGESAQAIGLMHIAYGE